MADEMFVGVRGHGSYVNAVQLPMLDTDAKFENAVVYSDVKTLDMFRDDAVGFTDKFISHRYLGSGALEICGVAANRFQVYAARVLMVWDVAAASIILSEVGGHFIFAKQEDVIPFTNEKCQWYSAVNQPMLDELMSYKTR